MTMVEKLEGLSNDTTTELAIGIVWRTIVTQSSHNTVNMFPDMYRIVEYIPLIELSRMTNVHDTILTKHLYPLPYIFSIGVVHKHNVKKYIIYWSIPLLHISTYLVLRNIC